MLIKPITYKDLDGKEITENFHFMIRKTRVIEVGVTGWLQDMFEKYSDVKSEEDLKKPEDRENLVKFFKEIIRMSIGRRSEDNRRFVQSDEIADEFMQTDAYDVLFWELFTKEGAMIEFFQEVFPKDLDLTELAVDSGEKSNPEDPAWIREDREPTDAEVKTMTQEQLQQAWVAKARRAKSE